MCRIQNTWVYAPKNTRFLVKLRPTSGILWNPDRTALLIAWWMMPYLLAC